MATRRERVVLELQDDFTTGMAKAAAVTALLNRELKDLDGSSVGARKGLDQVNNSSGLPALDRNAQKADRSINQLTGRLQLMAELGASLGPALIPLGGAALPALSTMATQAGALAGALGVTLLATKGLGDAFTALNDYQLAPTDENLQKLQDQFTKVGPAAGQFVRYIDSLEPQFRALQMTAREGLLPGVQDGIESFLQRAPQVRRIVSDIAEALGGLASDAGAGLGGERFSNFFDYLENEAAPILTEFGKTIGNFGEGLANLLVAFNPATQGFSAGLLEMSRSFSEWSRTLETNASFQEFLAYIQEAGPKALDFLGALINALSGVVTAAAPVGDVMLPILTNVLEVLGAIASSDIGTPIIAGLAALSAYNRALQVTGALTTTAWGGGFRKNLREASTALTTVTTAQDRARLSTVALTRMETQRSSAIKRGAADLGKATAVVGGLALASSGAADSIGLTNTASLALMGTMAGPWGAAAGGAVGLTMDLAAANNDLEASVDAANKAIATGSIDAMKAERDSRKALLADHDEKRDASLFETISPLAGLDNTIAGINELRGSADVGRESVKLLDEAIAAAEAGPNVFAAAVQETIGALQTQSDVMQENIGTMRERTGAALAAFDAETQWRNALVAAREAAKANEAGIRGSTKDALANREVLAQLAGAWNNQSEAVKSTEGRFKSARRAFIETATGMGVPIARAKELARELMEIPPARTTKVKLDGAASVKSSLDGIISQMFNLRDKTVRVRIVQEGKVPTGFGPQPTGSADGSTVPKTGRGYADRHLYLLADGEEVTSNRRGQADQFRPVLKAINAGMSRATVRGMLAGGGTAGQASGQQGGSRDQGFDSSAGGRFSMGVVPGVDQLRAALRDLTRGLRQSENALERETQKRDALQAMFDETASNARSTVRSDIFAETENPWSGGGSSPNDKLRTDISNSREFLKIIQQLRSKGLDGPAFAELLATQDLDKARFYASLPAKDLLEYENLYNQRDQLNVQVGNAAGGAVVPGLDAANASVKQWQAVVKEQSRIADKQTRILKAAIDALPKGIGGAINGAATSGHKSRPRNQMGSVSNR